MMKNVKETILEQILNWGPTIIVMAGIFWFSSMPSTGLKNFGVFDLIVKKGGHMMGYALLALSVSRGLGYPGIKRAAVVLGFVLLYALSDEFHQMYVPGRNPSLTDVLIDFTGGLIGLFCFTRSEWLQRIILYCKRN